VAEECDAWRSIWTIVSSFRREAHPRTEASAISVRLSLPGLGLKPGNLQDVPRSHDERALLDSQ